jgi:phage baseplate assembly protein V
MGLESDYIVNLINDLIDKRLNESVHIAIGTVTEYDPDLYLVKVLLAYEQVETPFIRLGGSATGNAFGDKNPPAIGDEVIVAFYSGTVETGIVISRLYSDPTDPPPVGDPADRILRHSTGSQITFKANGAISLAAAAQTSVLVNPDGSFAVSNGQASMKINPDNSLELSNAVTSIKITEVGKVSISNGVVELLGILDQLLAALTTPANVLVDKGTGIGGFNTVAVLALNVIKAELATLKV